MNRTTKNYEDLTELSVGLRLVIHGIQTSTANVTKILADAMDRMTREQIIEEFSKWDTDDLNWVCRNIILPAGYIDVCRIIQEMVSERKTKTAS